MQYRRLMLLGTGGMATVRLALATGPSGFNRLVVVKAMRDELLEQPEIRAMFLDEARLCARLNHPNVVQVSEVVDSPDGVMIVMEYLDGRPLSAMYRAGDSFTLPMRLRVVCEVLAGLHYVHELADFEGEPLGLVHRDVSPHNVFATFDGRVKLLDFGIAKATSSSEHTRTGVVKGKLAYMPAEQLRGHPVDRRSDIYSVGCILWEAVAGGRLWLKHSEKEIMKSVLHGAVPALGSRVTVDPRLERIVTRAMALDPDQRYLTAQDMRLELEELLQTTTAVSSRDIGQFLSLAFADESQRRSEEISGLIAALPDTGEIADEIATEFQATVTRTSDAEALRAPGWRRGLWIVLALGLAATPALVGPSAWRSFQRGAPSVEARPVEASQIALSVMVVPKTARVSVDGAPASIGGALLRVTVNSDHVVRAEADGYSTVERRVSLATDTALTLELSALAPPPTADQAASHAADQPRKSRAPSRKAQRPKQSAPFPAVAKVAAQSVPNCLPPYYFVDGIKAFKPECM